MQQLDRGSSRAKDFDTLVTASSDAQAYRPEEVEPTDTGLDLDRLAEALECVPLHERLAIPKDLLLPKQIAEFEHSAAQRLKSFEEKLRTIVTSEKAPDPAREDLQQVMAALTDRRDFDSRNDQVGDSDEDDDDGEVDPDNVVDWLDKVLGN